MNWWFWATGTHWEVVAVNHSSWTAAVPDSWWVAADFQPDVQKYSFFTTGLQKGLRGCFPARYPTLFHLFKSSQPGCFDPRPSTQGLRINHYPALNCLSENFCPTSWIWMWISWSPVPVQGHSAVPELHSCSCCQAVRQCTWDFVLTVLLHKPNKQMVEFKNNKHNASCAVRDRGLYFSLNCGENVGVVFITICFKENDSTWFILTVGDNMFCWTCITKQTRSHTYIHTLQIHLN